MRTEHALIQRTINGDLRAFDELMQLHQTAVFNCVNRIIQNHAHTLDICQEVFIKSFKNLKRFRFNSQFKTWLTRIAINETYSWIRLNAKRLQHQPIEDLPAQSIADNSPNPESRLISEESHLKLRVAISGLNPRYREAVNLRYFEEMPIREIAGIMNCTEGVIKSMLFRSLRKLKVILENME